MGISDSFSIALSGLQAAEAIVNSSAANIANAETEGYKQTGVNLSNLPNNGGVQVSSITTDPTLGPIDENGKEGSNTDLAKNLVDLYRAKTLYDANATVIKLASKLTGTLLDMFDDGSKKR